MNNDNIWWLMGITTGLMLAMILLNFLPKQKIVNKTIQQHLTECGIRVH